MGQWRALAQPTWLAPVGAGPGGFSLEPKRASGGAQSTNKLTVALDVVVDADGEQAPPDHCLGAGDDRNARLGLDGADAAHYGEAGARDAQGLGAGGRRGSLFQHSVVGPTLFNESQVDRMVSNSLTVSPISSDGFRRKQSQWGRAGELTVRRFVLLVQN